MGSIPEIKKRCKIVDEELFKDRISELPTDVVSHILSSLDIQQVVRASALSSRWKNCWTLITNLKLDDKYISPTLRPGFMNFVCRVVVGVNSLHKLRIKIRGNYDIQLLNACVAAVARPEIRELVIKYRSPGSSYISVPQNLFSCSELVVLKLDNNFEVDVPVSFCLSKLKTLCLSEVRLENGDSIARLLSGCPVLEELKFGVCFMENVRVINISSPTLKKLVLIYWCFEHLDQDSIIECIAIDTPLLQHLVIEDSATKAYSLNKLDHIIDALINIDDPSNEHSSSYCDAIIRLLDALSSARTINLTYHCFGEATGMHNHQFPKFQRLVKLEITAFELDWILLSKLLDRSPYLETLVMDFVHIENLPGEEDAWGEPDCRQFHLKSVTIRCTFREDKVKNALLVNYFEKWGCDVVIC